MKKVLGGGLAAALLAALFAVSGPAAASSPIGSPALDCSKTTDPSAMCVRWCYIEEGGNSPHPCGVNNAPHPTSGTYSFTAPLSAAEQDATGVPGDPGASGSSSITMNASTNQVCATTSWSGIDSKVVAGHIHGGQAGKPENPAITIDLFPADFVNGKTSPASGCTLVAPGEVYAMARCPSQFSLVVHSFNHPVGAIRGQLGTTCSLP